MKKKFLVVGLWVLGSSLFLPTDTQANEGDNGTPALEKQRFRVAKLRADTPHKETSLSGAEIYMRNCAGCHGEEGAGDGPVADSFDPRPRDFTGGLFAFRSTEYGGMPSDEDLLRTISEGIRWSAMPPFGKILSREEREAVLAHLKTLSKFYYEEDEAWYNFFELRGEPDPVAVPPPPKPTAEVLELGKKFYGDAEVGICYKCHGDTGVGDGSSAAGLKDAWDQPIRPTNLTRHIYKRGSEAREIYLRIRTGLPGSPMPEVDVLSDDEAWAVALYVKSLQQEPVDYIERGKLYYEAFGCIQCHGPEGSGGVKNPNYAKETIPPLNTLAEKMLIEYEEDADLLVELIMKNANLGMNPRYREIERSQTVLAQYYSIRDVIRNGNPAGSADPDGPLPAIAFMPAFEGILSAQDISAIVAYLLTLQPWEDSWEDTWEDTD